jgi:hypothetical protein
MSLVWFSEASIAGKPIVGTPSSERFNPREPNTTGGTVAGVRLEIQVNNRMREGASERGAKEVLAPLPHLGKGAELWGNPKGPRDPKAG